LFSGVGRRAFRGMGRICGGRGVPGRGADMRAGFAAADRRPGERFARVGAGTRAGAVYGAFLIVSRDLPDLPSLGVGYKTRSPTIF
jgi:hypothetical protein